MNNAGTVRLVLTPGQDNQATIDRQPAASNNFAVHVRHIHEIVDLFDDNAVQGFELPVAAAQAPEGGTTGGAGQPSDAVGLVGGYVAGVADPDAQHELQFVVAENGAITGTSRWAATGDFTLSGQMGADGSFLIADDAPERLGYRRGVYEGRVGENGSIEGVYYEQTQEQMSWPLSGQRAQ